MPKGQWFHIMHFCLFGDFPANNGPLLPHALFMISPLELLFSLTTTNELPHAAKMAAPQAL